MKKIIAFLMVASTAWALTTPPTNKEAAYLKHSNKVKNPGAENGTALVSVSAGTLTATTLTAELGLGARSFKWCPAAAGNTLSMSYYVVEGALKGQNGEASMLAQTSGTDFSLRIFDGSNQLATASTLTPSSSYQAWSQNFIFPSSGSLTVNAIAGNPTNCIFLDDAYLGRPSNLVEYSTGWTSAGTMTLSATTTAPSFGTATIVTNDVQYQRNSTNARVRISYRHTAAGTATAGSGDYLWKMPAGLLIDTNKVKAYSTVEGWNSSFQSDNSVGVCHVGTGANQAFGRVVVYDNDELRCFADDGASNQQGSISSIGFPLTSSGAYYMLDFEVPIQGWGTLSAVKADQADYGWTATTLTVGATTTAPGKGTTVNDSMLFRRNKENLELIVTYYQNGAGTAGLGAYLFKLPNGLQADTTKLKVPSTLPSATAIGIGGSVVGSGKIGTTSAGDTNYAFTGDVILYDADEIYMTTVAGSALSRQFPFSSSAATNFGSNPLYVTFFASIPIQGWAENQRAPALINSVISSYEGTTRIVAARLSSACAVSEEDGDWIASTTDNGTGDCTITINNGIFSQPPKCQFEVEATNAAINSGQTKLSTTTTPSATTIRYTTANSAGTLSDQAVNVICMGPK